MLPHIHLLGISVPMYSAMVFIGALAALFYIIFFVGKHEKIDRISQNRIIFVSIVGFLFLGIDKLGKKTKKQ
jgi:prolipoprotein diacylglyceryltransferase